MVKKIKEALQQGFKNLGLSDAVFERVAALAQTFIKDEADIPGFVSNTATKELLTSYQSEADKVRTSTATKIADLEAELARLKSKDPEPDKGKGDNGDKGGQPDIAATIQAAIENAVKPLTDKIAAIEESQRADNVVNTAKSAFSADAWVNGFPELRDAAWSQAIRVYERSGKKLTADELKDEAMECFKPLAKIKGLDITEPFNGGGAKDVEPDFSAMAERQRVKGHLPSEANKE